MQPLPHVYSVTAAAAGTSIVDLSAAGLPTLRSAAPAEFGGPGDQWSPESLLAAAIASCFVLGFRAVARASHLQWISLGCDVDATLDRKERVTQFTKVIVHARLIVPAAMDRALCERALEKAERSCLVANSLRCERELRIEIAKTPDVQWERGVG